MTNNTKELLDYPAHEELIHGSFANTRELIGEFNQVLAQVNALTQALESLEILRDIDWHGKWRVQKALVVLDKFKSKEHHE